MTVVSVVGTVNGHDVILTSSGNDRWDIKVPITTDGVYVAQFTATDAVGHQDTWAGLLYVFDSRPIRLELKCGKKQLCLRFETPKLTRPRLGDCAINSQRRGCK